jgi:peroxiredoxin
MMNFKLKPIQKIDLKTLDIIQEQSLFALGSREKVAITNIASDLIVMNFILGSWCPLCMKHIVEITKVLKTMGKSDFKIIVVTTEAEKPLRESLMRTAENGFSSERILFIPGASKSLLNAFSLRIPIFGFAKPATFLIENLKSIQVLSEGVPNKEKISCSLSGYFSEDSKVSV